jgi:2-methylcitrate dehydratase PrpD
VLEGEHGLYAAIAGGHDAARLAGQLDTLGRVWELGALTLKPYPCGSIAQPYMDCAARLRERHGIGAASTASIRCRTSAGPVPRLWEPLAAKHAPANGYAAKFSLPYLIAVILVKGRAGLAEFTDAAVRDRDVLALASRVTYEIDPTIDYPRQFVGDVEVTLGDGSRLRERQDRPRGGADAPLTRAEIEAKFRGNAELALPASRADAIIAAVSRLPAAPSLKDVMTALIPENRR